MAHPDQAGPTTTTRSVLRRLRAEERIAVDIAGVIATQVYGDANQLARAVGNLADNAVRHARTSVTLALAESEGQAVLTVTDDGPGIAAEHQATVFERFTLLDSARNRAQGGSGLGLAIARDIAERHRGTLVLDSSYQAGARFVLTISVVSSGGE